MVLREDWELRGSQRVSRSCLTSRRGPCGPALGEQPVAGERAAAVHDDDAGERDPDQVVLEAFAACREIAEPVHEESVRRVRAGGASQDSNDAKRGEAATESEDQRER